MPRTLSAELWCVWNQGCASFHTGPNLFLLFPICFSSLLSAFPVPLPCQSWALSYISRACSDVTLAGICVTTVWPCMCTSGMLSIKSCSEKWGVFAFPEGTPLWPGAGQGCVAQPVCAIPCLLPPSATVLMLLLATFPQACTDLESASPPLNILFSKRW